MKPQYVNIVGGTPKVLIMGNVGDISIRTDSTAEITLDDPGQVTPTWVPAPAAGGNGLIAIKHPIEALRLSNAGAGKATVLVQGIMRTRRPARRALVLGPELLANGDFSQGSTGWTLGAGWTVVGGQLVATAAAQDTFTQSVASAVTAGKRYRIRATCTAYTSGGWKLLLEGGANVFGDKTSAGTFQADILAAVTGSIYVWANSVLTASFDDISVREIIAS